MGRGWVSLFVVALVSSACSGSKVEDVSERMSVEPAELDFGSVVVRGGAEKSVVVKNPGRSGLSIEMAEAPSGVSIEPRRFRVEPGGKREIAVIFSPSQANEVEGELALQSTGAGTQARIRVKGRGIADALGIPEELDFGWVVLGQSRSLFLPVENLTDAALDLSLHLEADTGFSVAMESHRLEPRETANVEVRFAPTSVGAARTPLVLRPCRECREIEVSLRGTGARHLLLATPERVDFGRVAPGIVTERTVTLENPGSVPVVIHLPVWDPLLPSPPFTVEGLEEPRSLDPGQSVEIVIRFAPRGAETEERKLLLYDDKEELLLEIPVTGRAGGPRIELSPPTIDFGLRPTEIAFTKSVTIENTGAAETVKITSIRLEGAGRQAFSLVYPTLPLEVGTSSQEILVTALARQAGLQEAEVVFSSTSTAQPVLRLPLSMDAVAAKPCDLHFEPKELRFGSVRPPEKWSGLERYRTVREVVLTNRGSEPCLLWGARIQGDAAEYFRWKEPLPEVRSLSTGEELELSVEIDVASAPEEVPLLAELLIHHVGRDEPLHIPLSAMHAFVWYPDLAELELSFEPTPVGRASAQKVPRWGEVHLPLVYDTSDAFIFTNPEYPSDPLMEVAFVPWEVGVHRGQLEVYSMKGMFPYVVDFEAEAIPPCDDCDWPEPFCLPDSVMEARERLEFDDAEWENECNWGPSRHERRRIYRNPTDSQHSIGATIHPNGLYSGRGKSCWGHVNSEFAGEYGLGNLRVRPDGRGAYCHSTIQVNPRKGLWIEVVRPDTTDWLDYVSIVYGGNPLLVANWENLENACHLFDSIVQPYPCLLGGEVPLHDDSVPYQDKLFRRVLGWLGRGYSIHVRDPDRTGIPYHFGVAAAPHHTGDTVNVRVFCDRSLVYSGDFNLTKGKFTVLGSVEFHEPSGCTFTPDGITSWETDEG